MSTVATSQENLILARFIAASHWREYPGGTQPHKNYADEIEAGLRDGCEAVQVALRALRTMGLG